MTWFQDKRVVIMWLLLIAIAVSFWSTSRVPALSEKALLGGDIELNALGFETVLSIDESDPLLKKTLYSTINWLETNRKGMFFGVVFASVLMTLLSLFKRRSFKSGFSNSLLGMTIGAPLGVCVNCAAPIATGLYASGARAETSVAAMISSPTLNIIVLTMLFSLFPLYLVLIKLGITVLFILLVIPVISRVLASDVLVCNLDQSCDLPMGMNDPADGAEFGWWDSVVWTAKNFPLNLWDIIKRTVPLMFAAGFIGALAITVLPWDMMVDLLPTSGSRLNMLMAMSVLGAIGLFLPVPIAFDVLVTAVLLASGLPVKYAMVLLFTLGVFSVYSFSIVWTTISKRLAVGITVVLFGCGLAAGVVAGQYSEWDDKRQSRLFFDTFDSTSQGTKFSASSGITVRKIGDVTDELRFGDTDADLVRDLQSESIEADPVLTNLPANIQLSRISYQPNSSVSDTGFERIEGDQIGIDEPYYFSVKSQITIKRFRGIASGDIHDDGWVDILLTSERGLSLFANRGGQHFERQSIPIPGLADYHVVNAALVDLNNDGWLDIFFATYREGNYVVYNNQEGRFLETNLSAVPNLDGAILTAAAGFGDLDHDGDLDVAIGNWSLGFLGLEKTSTVTSSRNAILENQGDRFTLTALDGPIGETLATLVSDIDGDGDLDLIVSNDIDPPDRFYLGEGDGSFRETLRSDGLIPHTTASTMSLISADIDNDLSLEVYLGQISGMSGTGEMEIRRVDPDLCVEIVRTATRAACEETMAVQNTVLRSISTRNVFECFKIKSTFELDCIAVNLIFWSMRWHVDQSMCDLFPPSWEIFSFVCNRKFGERSTPTQQQMDESIPQFKNTFNVLLSMTEDGRFVDIADKIGLGVGGWTWNAKFADLDNDEWQDLYIVNGSYFTGKRESNLFFQNEGGKRFVDKTLDNNLESFLATSAYTYVDYDNDGSLDIVVVPVAGPISVYRNNLPQGNSIAFELRDSMGNHFGIGSKITIYYGADGGSHQMRELLASGGFVSFDAPIAYFGLGSNDHVSRVTITWPTGEVTEIRTKLPAGARYIVRRTGN